MKSLHIAPQIILFHGAVLALATVLSATSTLAENVPVSLSLIASADPNTNRADVDFTIDAPSINFNQTQSTQTDLSGSLSALIDIDFAPVTHEATANTITLNPGALFFSDMNVTFNLAGSFVDIDTLNMIGSLSTPGAPSVVAGGDFAAANHQANIDSGTVTTNPLIHAPRDFSVDPIMEMLDAATATVSIAKNGLPVGLVQTYDVTVTVPFTFSSTQMVSIPSPIGGPDIPADETMAFTAGTIVATGSFVHTVPEPTSILLSLIGAVLAIFVVRRM